MTGPDLKALRNRLGLTVRVCAAQVDVTERAWANWEAGKYCMPEDVEKRFLRRHRAEISALPK